MTPQIRYLPGVHLTYPHANGFDAASERLLLATHDPDAGGTGIVSVAWPSLRAQRTVHAVRGTAQGKPLWFDVAVNAGLVAWTRPDSLVVAELTEPGTPRVVYTVRADARLDGLCSITADGDRVAIIEVDDGKGTHRLGEVDVATGLVTWRLTRGREANHVQYSPHDPAWIGFAHEGPAPDTADRVQAWHAGSAPDGRCILDQSAISDSPGVFVAVGHERWTFHQLGAAAVAYGISAAGPRGLYFAGPERVASLIARGERFWHCDVSRDGRWAVVDTQGPHDSPGRGRAQERQVSDVVLIDTTTGRTSFLARTFARSHPHHPHPVFSPDGGSVLFNHAEPDSDGISVGVVDLQNL